MQSLNRNLHVPFRSSLVFFAGSWTHRHFRAMDPSAPAMLNRKVDAVDALAQQTTSGLATTSALLELPVEVRQIIYSHLLSDRWLTVSYSKGKFTGNHLTQKDHSGQRKKICGMLFTCRLVHQELQLFVASHVPHTIHQWAVRQAVAARPRASLKEAHVMNIRVLELFHHTNIDDIDQNAELDEDYGLFGQVLQTLPALREVRFLACATAKCLASATCPGCIQRLVLNKLARPQLEDLNAVVTHARLRDIRTAVRAHAKDLKIEIRRPIFQVLYFGGNAEVDKLVDWSKYYAGDQDGPRYLVECLVSSSMSLPCQWHR
jgi:hypothetical protein